MRLILLAFLAIAAAGAAFGDLTSYHCIGISEIEGVISKMEKLACNTCDCALESFGKEVSDKENQRKNEIDMRIAKLFTRASDNLLKEISLIDYSYQSKGKELLGDVSKGIDKKLADSCSFDAIKDKIPCSNDPKKRAQVESRMKLYFDSKDEKELVKKLVSKFDKYSQDVDIRNNEKQCLSPKETKVLGGKYTFNTEKETLINTLKDLSKDNKLIKSALESKKSPFDLILSSRGQILDIISDIPHLKLAFESKESFKNLMNAIVQKPNLNNDDLNNILIDLDVNLKENLARKCENLFKTVGQLICGEPNTALIKNNQFQKSYMGFDPEDHRESFDLEKSKQWRKEGHSSSFANFLFMCKEKECSNSKKASTDKLCLGNKNKTAYSPNKIIDTLLENAPSTLLLEEDKSIDRSNRVAETMNETFCKLLVCENAEEMKWDGEVACKKMSPPRSYADVVKDFECKGTEDDGTFCTDMPKESEAFFEYMREQMGIDARLGDVANPNDGGSEGGGPANVRKRKPSLFIDNMRGHVGRSIDDGKFDTEYVLLEKEGEKKEPEVRVAEERRQEESKRNISSTGGQQNNVVNKQTTRFMPGKNLKTSDLQQEQKYGPYPAASYQAPLAQEIERRIASDNPVESVRQSLEDRLEGFKQEMEYNNLSNELARVKDQIRHYEDLSRVQRTSDNRYSSLVDELNRYKGKLEDLREQAPVPEDAVVADAGKNIKKEDQTGSATKETSGKGKDDSDYNEAEALGLVDSDGKLIRTAAAIAEENTFELKTFEMIEGLNIQELNLKGIDKGEPFILSIKIPGKKAIKVLMTPEGNYYKFNGKGLPRDVMQKFMASSFFKYNVHPTTRKSVARLFAPKSRVSDFKKAVRL